MALREKIITAEFGYGAQLRDTANGPKQIINILKKPNISILPSITLNNTQVGKDTLPTLLDCSNQISLAIQTVINANHFPIILGGDHSIAIGTWSGVIKALNAKGDFGLIWIDAHMDSHTYDSSPSKAYHGMPLAALLGFGEFELVNLSGYKNKINPKHLVVMGIRSYEPEEKSLLEKLGVKIFYAEELHNRGMESVMKEAINIASRAVKGYGISLDLDFFDPEFAPGVGSPETNGFDPKDFIRTLHLLKDSPLKAFELVELNPSFDIDNKTASIAAKIVDEVIKNCN